MPLGRARKVNSKYLSSPSQKNIDAFTNSKLPNTCFKFDAYFKKDKQ